MSRFLKNLLSNITPKCVGGTSKLKWRVPAHRGPFHSVPAPLIIGALAVTLCSCGQRSTTVMLDQHWDKGFAARMCHASECDTLVRDFELDLATQFAAQPACHSVRFRMFDSLAPNPDAFRGVEPNYWTLQINYEIGAPRQTWQLIQQDVRGSKYQQGGGTPRDIAADICNILRAHGADVST